VPILKVWTWCNFFFFFFFLLQTAPHSASPCLPRRLSACKLRAAWWLTSDRETTRRATSPARSASLSTGRSLGGRRCRCVCVEVRVCVSVFPFLFDEIAAVLRGNCPAGPLRSDFGRDATRSAKIGQFTHFLRKIAARFARHATAPPRQTIPPRYESRIVAPFFSFQTHWCVCVWRGACRQQLEGSACGCMARESMGVHAMACHGHTHTHTHTL
jgi:hypothetical protein